MIRSNSLAALAIAALPVLLGTAGCSSDIGGGPADASGSDGGTPVDVGLGAFDSSSSGESGSSGSGSGAGGGTGSGSAGGPGSASSSGVAAEASVPRKYDGTVGMPCQISMDCKPPGGAGVNVCSNEAFTGGPLWPTPICLLMHCDPVGSGSSPQYCDGPPTDPASPGICLPTTSPAQPGMGICMPKCEFGRDGSAPTGCQGKDACNAAGVGRGSSGAVTGMGYCFGGCTGNADCPAGSACQLDEGTCLTAPYSRTKTLGQSCTSADSASTNHACLCDYNPGTNQGYCSQSCIVGGMPCPSGYVCGTGETALLVGLGADGGTIPGFATQNPGMAGLCRAVCQGSGDAGGPCPPNSSCNTGDTVGPTCAP